MDTVKSLILIARARLRLGATLEALATGLVAAAVVLALLVLTVKLVPGVSIPEVAVYGSAAAGGLIAAIAAWMLRARVSSTDARIALMLDERLKLDERMTSALAFERSSDVYARAAIADAASVASDASIRPRVRAAFPVRFPNRGLAGAVAFAALVCIQWFVPAYEWPVDDAAAADTSTVARKKATEEALERITQELESKSALPQELRDSMAQMAKNADSKVGGEAGDEDARREAIRRMSELSNRLDELKKSDVARRNEALKRDLAGLEKQDGAIGQFTEDLAKGDFASAKQKLEDLAKEMQAGNMSDAEKAAAAEALEKMAKSLENLAEKQQSLKDELEKAGLDAQLANNPEALERAIDQNQNLTDQQREQLKQAVQASKASQDALKRMASASKNAANKQRQQQQQQQQQGQQGQRGQQGQQGDGGLAELAQSLSELEVTQQMLEEAEALSSMAQNESESLGEGMCKGGNCQNGGQQGQAGNQPSMGQGGRRGGAGRAEGGNTGKAKTPTGTKTVKAKTENAGGDIIARQLIDNPNPEVAESVMPTESVDAAVDGGSGMAVGEDQVPSHLKDAHKHYFGTLKKELTKKGDAAPAAGGTASPGSK